MENEDALKNKKERCSTKWQAYVLSLEVHRCSVEAERHNIMMSDAAQHVKRACSAEFESCSTRAWSEACLVAGPNSNAEPFARLML
eukprot:1158842-Pelagomonas_calceolata.AAC.5